jgi:hypothetical protein
MVMVVHSATFLSHRCRYRVCQLFRTGCQLEPTEKPIVGTDDCNIEPWFRRREPFTAGRGRLSLTRLDHFRVLRLLFYLEDHSNDDNALMVVNGSHKVPGLANLLPGVVNDFPPHTLRPAAGDAILFDVRLVHSSGFTLSYKDQPSGSIRSNVQLAFGLKGSAFTNAYSASMKARSASSCSALSDSDLDTLHNTMLKPHHRDVMLRAGIWPGELEALETIGEMACVR